MATQLVFLQRRANNSFYWLTPLFFLVISLAGCKKGGSDTKPTTPSVPVVTTTTPSNITSTSLEAGGTVTADGGSPITERGILWSSSYESADAHKTILGTGTGAFTTSLSGLYSYSTYFMRAYAINSTGIGYGNTLNVSTHEGVPAMKTDSVYVDDYKYYVVAEILSSGGKPITEWGLCWSTKENPTIADYVMTESSSPDVTVMSRQRIWLSINTTYYVRAYGKNSHGVGYGNQVSFTTGIDIGLQCGGGIIYELDASGQHGKVVSLNELSASCPWAKSSATGITTNATTDDGAINTTRIINAQGNSGTYAAKLCRDYRAGGFTDWYLPTTWDLFSFLPIGTKLELVPPHEFLTEYYYWSSTERNCCEAYGQDIFYGVNNFSKGALWRVRAIRVF